ncbi:hypothetical protein HK096_003738 [Nowakowskiella sp. JEL0078]|nr:hypothetical protein HK096_003738 [Nowakowskiella sp. JEL0078]
MCGVIAEGTAEAAYQAAQVAVSAAKYLFSEKNEVATFAMCRPPGHHAHKDLCGGYCFYNNTAIATQWLIDQGAGKVAILDIDYHHGNGTQTLFYDKSNPLYVSLHAAPDYPYYWGSLNETGKGDGEGANVNIPLPLGTQDEEYISALKHVIETKILAFQPDFLVVSLGLDTFEKDPVGGFFLTSDAYSKIGYLISAIGVRTLFILEGGYAVAELGNNVVNMLSSFEDNILIKDK